MWFRFRILDQLVWSQAFYKIIAKILSLHLKKVIGKVMNVSQGAFVKGRQIIDGILIATECMDGMQFDLEKAYDRVD